MKLYEEGTAFTQQSSITNTLYFNKQTTVSKEWSFGEGEGEGWGLTETSDVNRVGSIGQWGLKFAYDLL